MTPILSFIKSNINEIIILFGIIISVLLLSNGVKLSNHKSRIKEALERNNKQYRLNLTTREMEENEDKDAAITPDTIRTYETNFNKACSVHNVLIQFIPIFPLLGILGTVTGLILEVQSNDITSMMASLDTALTSTFYGLVFAIVLKGIEAVYPSRVINDVEIMLDDFDKKLSIAEMFQNFKDK